MSDIAVFTMGTRGDVQPYLYLGRALTRAKHNVVIGTHPCWRSLVENAGLSFAPIGPDVDIEKEAAVIRGKNPNVVMSMLKTMKFVFGIIETSTSDIYDCCKEKDLIIVSHSQMGAAEAEVLGIPVVNVTLQTEMIPQRRKPLTFKDKIVGKIVSRQICKPYNKVRKVYNLPPLADSGDLIGGKVNLIPISAHVQERNPYWEEHHIMTGYWYEEDEDYVPDAALSEFLQKGDAPIILALGAMSFESESDRQKLDMFVAAFRETGKRAVIQGFQKTLQDYELPDTMMACGSVPHSWLFRQGYAVIHHCGFGTSSAAMLYGIPSIPVPHVLDQIGFAKQMEALGVSTKMISAKELSASRLILAINELSENYDTFTKTVRSLSEKLREENGLDTAVSEIDKILHGAEA